MGWLGRIVKEQYRGGASVKVVPQPVKVIVSHTTVYVNNVFCKRESSMISGTYEWDWAFGAFGAFGEGRVGLDGGFADL